MTSAVNLSYNVKVGNQNSRTINCFMCVGKNLTTEQFSDLIQRIAGGFPHSLHTTNLFERQVLSQHTLDASNFKQVLLTFIWLSVRQLTNVLKQLDDVVVDLPEVITFSRVN